MLLKATLMSFVLLPSIGFSDELDVTKFVAEVNEVLEPVIEADPEFEFMRPQDLQILYAKADAITPHSEIVEEASFASSQDLVFEKGNTLLKRDTSALSE